MWRSYSPPQLRKVLLDYIPDPQLELVLVMLIVSFVVNMSASQRVSESKWIAQRGTRVSAGTWKWSPSAQDGAEPTVETLDTTKHKKENNDHISKDNNYCYSGIFLLVFFLCFLKTCFY